MSARPTRQHQWHAAARAGEVGHTPLARTICGVPLVLFRRRDGQLCVLEDRCPHMPNPLSHGAVVGDDIECGYHGLRFNGDGACTHMPAQKEIPGRITVRSFAVAERRGVVFVFMGEVAHADVALIPDCILGSGAS